jgi:hypothetical protein
MLLCAIGDDSVLNELHGVGPSGRGGKASLGYAAYFITAAAFPMVSINCLISF